MVISTPRLVPSQHRQHAIAPGLTYDDPQSLWSKLSPSASQLPFFIDSPNRSASFGNVGSQSSTDRIDGIGKPGGHDDEIVFPRSVAVQDHLVFLESIDISLLDLDLALDHVGTGSSVKVESSVLGQSKRGYTGISLTSETLKPGRFHIVQKIFVELGEFGGASSSHLFPGRDGHGLGDPVSHFERNLVFGVVGA